MTPKTHTFSIETTDNPGTGQPFGPAYAGVFTIRKPTIKDKIDIETAKARILSARGTIDQQSVERGTLMMAYIFALVEVCGDGNPPKWWNLDTMEDDSDEDAIFAVLAEVSLWLNTFRAGAAITGSAEAGQ